MNLLLTQAGPLPLVAVVAARVEVEVAVAVLATLYVGNITTGGRTEVTALGDEVNEPPASRRAPPED